ncbi:Cytoplasmic protein, partial [Monkeypox virus]
EMC